jgi:hypothetical protein
LKKQTLGIWMIALVLTLVLAVYQRASGPTHPIKRQQSFPAAEVKYKFHRSWTSHDPLPVRVAGEGLAAMNLHYRRYPLLAGEKWSVIQMVTKNGSFQAFIPGQPAAGKVAYKVEIMTPAGTSWLNEGIPVVARFKNKVPAWLLILHVIFMFAGLLLAFRAGLGALFNDDLWQRLVPWTLVVTLLGGLVLGPLVQKYAFGALWTGFPLGGDLTDTKILFALLFWLAALFLRKKSRWWIVLVTVLMVGVYLIPHSAQGSELDYRTGKIGTARTLAD